MSHKQLYSIVRDIELPARASRDAVSKSFFPRVDHLPALFAVYWPNNQICLPIEMYLLDIGQTLTIRRTDGGSLKVYVSDLSHLIRYCWTHRVHFWDLTDGLFDNFVDNLVSERNPRNPSFRRRNNNTVIRIIDRCIHFLYWLQSNIFLDRIIVGTREQGPQIRLLLKKIPDYRGNTNLVLCYPRRPPHEARDPKPPMPSMIRNKLWDAVSLMADPSSYSKRYRSRFQNDKSFYEELEFHKTKRELMLILLEAFGERPQELARLSLRKNSNCMQSKKIILKTIKRRKKVDPDRSIPIESGIAIKLELFIKIHRAKMLRRLQNKGIVTASQDSVFLNSKNGSPLTERSLSKEFQRIVQFAGVEQRACMSMFRHRFITNMVKLHLQAFLDDNHGKNKFTMTEGDYRTILKKVRVFTGHGSEESLMSYISVVWEELGVFDYAEPAYTLMTIVEGSANTLSSMISDIKLSPDKPSEQVVKDVVKELHSLRNRTNEAMQAMYKKRKATS